MHHASLLEWCVGSRPRGFGQAAEGFEEKPIERRVCFGAVDTVFSICSGVAYIKRLTRNAVVL